MSRLHSVFFFRFQTRLVTELELSHYLEKYLWPKFDPLIVTKHYLLSIVLLVNEKYKQRVSAWKVRKKGRIYY